MSQDTGAYGLGYMLTNSHENIGGPVRFSAGNQRPGHQFGESAGSMPASVRAEDRRAGRDVPFLGGAVRVGGSS